jgi:hypothetical protein
MTPDYGERARIIFHASVMLSHFREKVVIPASFDFVRPFDHCCYAWNTLIERPWKIMSIAHRDWAAAGHSI